MAVGGGKGAKGPAGLPVVLYSLAGTKMSSASGDVGAYLNNSNSDGVRKPTVTVVTVFDEEVMPVILPQS